MDHSFNIKAAKLYGVEEAVLLHNIYFWIKKNKANNKHFYDGYFWTYNSVEAFSELFPYWTKRQVERILNNLIKKGAIIKANYNEKAYDRTSWYAITQTVESIYANGEMDFTKRGNGFNQTVEPIPDINTDSNTINNKDTIDFEKLKDFISQKTGRNFKVINKKLQGKYLARLKEGYSKQDILDAVSNAVKSDYHKGENFKYLTPEFFSRAVTLDKYSNVNNKQKENSVKKSLIPKGVSFSGPQY